MTGKGLNGAPKLMRLREKLGRKAKEDPTFRFYSLYGHLLREDVLWTAWDLVRRKKGSPGIDNISLEQIERSEKGVEGFLEEIADSLRDKSYREDPVKRVYIPKPNGKLRPLGIPTIKDRVVQCALVLILEPIFEADFCECSYGFRPNRSAHQALDAIKGALTEGKLTVYDADLKGYFDSIPHDKLMKVIEQRVSDRRVLNLIRLWLKALIVDKGGTKHRPKEGTPQGGVISPLLANAYLHLFDDVFHRRLGPANWAKATLVRYADDFVILARHQSQQLTQFIEERIESWLGVTINRDKTNIVDLKEKGQELQFLGHSFKWISSRQGWRYCYLTPSKEAESRAREKIKELTDKRRGLIPVVTIVSDLNLYLKGWQGYFRKGSTYKCYRRLNWFVGQRLSRHLMRRSQRGYKIGERSWYRFFEKIGVYRLRKVGNSACLR